MPRCKLVGRDRAICHLLQAHALVIHTELRTMVNETEFRYQVFASDTVSDQNLNVPRTVLISSTRNIQVLV